MKPNQTLPLLLLALALAGVSWPQAARAGEFPVSSLGDIWFQADHAGFLSEDGKVVEEYYVRILNGQLLFQEQEDGSLQSRVFVKIKFLDDEDKEVGETSERFEFSVPDAAVAGSADDAQLLLVRDELDPRARTARIQVDDLNARKRGLLYMITGKRKNGKAEGRLAPPPFLDRDLATSDLQFAWAVNPEGVGSPFQKHGLEVIPNPSRSYGLLQPELTLLYQVYDRGKEGTGPHTYVARHEILGDGGAVAITARDTVSSRAGRWTRVARFDLSTMSPGPYIARVVVTDPEGQRETITERAFSVIWRTESWDRTEEDILNEARVLFREEEYERFREMSAGNREVHVEQFWADVDPTPRTAANEVRQEFMRRVGYADLHFSSPNRRGMLSDRGRIYIRFGEADEIIQELMPTQDRQLDGLVQDLTRENIGGSTLSTSDQFDTRPYEIWNYTRQGTPLFPDREQATSVTGLRFVFVDESGTGNYVMRYASDFIGY